MEERRVEWYDTRRLFEDADARTIVRALYDRDDYRQSGATLFCRCPGGHRETRLDHCAVYKTGCKCFSCGERFDTKEMVERYFAERGEDLNFSEICGKIADVLGGRELYLTGKSSKAVQKKELPLQMSELEVIGIYSPEHTAGVPTVSGLYEADPEACILFLRKRAEDYLEKYSVLRDSEENPELREEWDRRHRITRQIIIKLGGKIDTVPRLFHF